MSISQRRCQNFGSGGGGTSKKISYLCKDTIIIRENRKRRLRFWGSEDPVYIVSEGNLEAIGARVEGAFGLERSTVELSIR